VGAILAVSLKIEVFGEPSDVGLPVELPASQYTYTYVLQVGI
jgi:hypothetical protein